MTTSVSRAVGGAAGRKADDDWDLGTARRADHGLEDQADGVQGLDALGEPGATGMPDADDRCLLGDRGVDGVDDVGTTNHSHGTAHHGAIGAVGHGGNTVDRSDGGLHPGERSWGAGPHRALVEELVKRSSGSRGSLILQWLVMGARVDTLPPCVVAVGSSHCSRVAGCASHWLVASNRDGHVVAAETERVVECVFVVAFAGFARDDVDVTALGIEIVQVEGRRDNAFLNRLHRQHRLRGAHGTDQWPSADFGA